MEWITRAKDQQRVVDVCTICEKALVIPPRNVDRFSLHLICEGSVVIKIEESVYELTSPCLLCVNEYKEVEVLKTQNLKCRNIIFNPVFLNINMTVDRIHNTEYEELSEQHSLYQLEPFLSDEISKSLFYLNEEQIKFFASCFDHMEYELKVQSDWYWSCRARSFFMDIINSLDKLCHGFYFEWNKTRRQDVYFTQIAEFIDKNLHKNITLALVCNKFSINRNKLEALFKSNVSVSFYQYVKQQRLERACYYLRFTELSLSEIAEQTGFSSSQNFSRFFSSVMKQTPIGYRRNAIG